MSSVTQRVKSIQQPYGGYLSIKSFEIKKIEDNNELMEENIPASIVGTAVDYLTRFLNGSSKEKAFEISLKGAFNIKDSTKALDILNNICGLDNNSIYNACKLVGYDVCFRSKSSNYKDIDLIVPDTNTIENIKIMVKRSLKFIKEYGPITKDGFTFEGGYTHIIDSGDGDFLTDDTLWDFKVLSSSPTTKHTLQLLVYYVMGKHSTNLYFSNINKIGIYNPRLNIVYIKKISEIDNNTLIQIENEVIGYNNINKKNNIQKKNNLQNNIEDLLTINDLTLLLQCSRNTIMKYYWKNNLPLFKKNNRYYIKRCDYILWKNKMLENQSRIIKENLIASCIFLIVLCIFFIYFIFKLY